ncbi:MAG: hypothetical protein E7E72_11005 [Clostridium sp.]|nr:hypothetical protein [Clostridium sp.]
MRSRKVCFILSFLLIFQLVSCSKNNIDISNQYISEENNIENKDFKEKEFSYNEMLNKAYEILEDFTIEDGVVKDLISNKDKNIVEEFKGDKKALVANERIASNTSIESKRIYTITLHVDSSHKLKSVTVYVDRNNLDVLGVDLD